MSDNPEAATPRFARLRQVADALGVPVVTLLNEAASTPWSEMSAFLEAFTAITDTQGRRRVVSWTSRRWRPPAARGRPTPRANEATRPMPARVSHLSSLSGAIARTIVWNAPTTSRASTSAGTPSSTAATVSVSALVKRSRPVVSHRARVRADGTRCSRSILACSARRRRVAHSPTTRSDPRKPCPFALRQSSVALRLPASHWASSQGR